MWGEELVDVLLNSWMLCPSLDYTLGEDGVPVLDSSLYQVPDPIKRGDTLVVVRNHPEPKKLPKEQGDLDLFVLRGGFQVVHRFVFDGTDWLQASPELPVGPLRPEEMAKALQSGG